MYYVELDAKNLVNWFTANQGALDLDNNTGYTLYFSDRRGEQKDTTAAPLVRTGSYGYNDFVNPNDPANGCSNTVLDPGEDFEGDGIFRTYGGTEMAPALISTAPPLNYMLPHPEYSQHGAPAHQHLDRCDHDQRELAWRHLQTGSHHLLRWAVCQHELCAGQYQPSRCYLRQRAGSPDKSSGVLPSRSKNRRRRVTNIGVSCNGTDGLSIVAENPVYIQGDYNAPVDDGTWGGVSIAAAVEGDAVTFLSNNWNDVNSFAFPYNVNNRAAAPTAYRAAIISGKGIPFPSIAGQAQDFGTDGGVHNFLRFLENWGLVCHYRGSMVSFYYNRQAVGTYKGTGVYNPPSPRDYTFDTNFTLGPACLPPRTPSLRSVNTIGFSQEILPTQ